MGRYVALLRGINVGGNNIIPMADLRACFEGGGFTDVATYIQSGNVVFSATGTAADLTERIARMLSSAFSYDATLTIRTRSQMRATIERAPDGFGGEPDRFRYDAIYLMPPLTPAAAMREISLREGVDTIAAGPGVLYHSRLIALATQSRLSKIVASPIYPRITIRNWNTTTKLLAMFDA
jgi:uncharacterized protein (DUF1697 family)